jgi:hypothetical protein
MKHSIFILGLAIASFGSIAPRPVQGQDGIFIEAESFSNHGGWVLDTQFIEFMGSPYMMAHGLGKPVADAVTKVSIPEAGRWNVFVRTKDWVAHWDAKGAPGVFRLSWDGKEMPVDFGNQGAEWHWQKGGAIELPAGEVEVKLIDKTGFNGRCDAIFLTRDENAAPPDDAAALALARKKWLGHPAVPASAGEFDLVVVGGGYAGTAAAISAARQGLKVALVQNRPVLGGNGSSEIRVWAQGGTMRGKYPRLGEIVEEFADRAMDSPGIQEEYGDEIKEKIVRAEPNLSLFLNHHATAVVMTPDKKLISEVHAIDTRSGELKRFIAPLFSDCTGHGTLGWLAGAKFTMLEKGHLGMSNMWYCADGTEATSFAAMPWALDLGLDDFPAVKGSKRGPGDFLKGEWFWESGFDKHPIEELEYVRDWNLRAVFGAFHALKNGPEKDKYAKSQLLWVAYVGGTRESRLLEGDIILTEDHIVSGTEFPDGCVPTTWDLDLHYPKEQYMKKYPDNPFISRAVFGKGVDRKNGYPVPYRCFYSVNIENLFMAGRNISVTHEALGTTRVMRTCGMMGEVVGKAAYLCVKNKTSPRGVYEKYLTALIDLMEQPGAMRRSGLDGELQMPADAKKVLPYGPSTEGNGVEEFLPIAKLAGIVVDDNKAVFTGTWTKGEGLPGYVGDCYRYASGTGQAKYTLVSPKAGRYDVRLSWQPHENRATNVKVKLVGATGGDKEFTLNMKEKAPLENGFASLGQFDFPAGKEVAVIILADGANGNVHADCVQALPVDP